MGCDVFANNNEIACKGGDGKVIAAFPDVCLSPPSPPAGPVPIPYPDTSFSKDMMSGSKTVKIKNQEVMLKDKSFYKTAPLGNEAATNGLGAGVVTHVITGKTYFTMWSMDVKVEGENVDRHIDLTTSNHASAGNSAPGPNTAAATSVQKCPHCGKNLHDTGKYPRSKSERKEALLRDAQDPESDLSPSARKFILKHKGNRVPRGYEVSHEEPLYTKPKSERCKLDKARNMKTQRRSEHRKRHEECGDQYRDYPR